MLRPWRYSPQQAVYHAGGAANNWVPGPVTGFDQSGSNFLAWPCFGPHGRWNEEDDVRQLAERLLIVASGTLRLVATTSTAQVCRKRPEFGRKLPGGDDDLAQYRRRLAELFLCKQTSSL